MPVIRDTSPAVSTSSIATSWSLPFLPLCRNLLRAGWSSGTWCFVVVDARCDALDNGAHEQLARIGRFPLRSIAAIHVVLRGLVAQGLALGLLVLAEGGEVVARVALQIEDRLVDEGSHNTRRWESVRHACAFGCLTKTKVRSTVR